MPKKFFWKLSGREMEAALAKAAHEEIKKAHAAGQPTTHGDNDGVFLLYPDGRKEYTTR